ncbi:MAG: hypothetical protein V1662_05670 [Candidatus Omnitrophota bacterium]
MNEKNSYAVKISSSLIKRLKDFCSLHGLKQGHLVEQALLEKLDNEERLGDILKLQRLKRQEAQAIDFEQYLQEKNV